MCFFFKQKTAYEMRISDWSSDVCSSDLNDDALKISCLLQGQGGLVHRDAGAHRGADGDLLQVLALGRRRLGLDQVVQQRLQVVLQLAEIGRASCRERGCQYV